MIESLNQTPIRSKIMTAFVRDWYLTLNRRQFQASHSKSDVPNDTLAVRLPATP